MTEEWSSALSWRWWITCHAVVVTITDYYCKHTLMFLILTLYSNYLCRKARSHGLLVNFNDENALKLWRMQRKLHLKGKNLWTIYSTVIFDFHGRFDTKSFRYKSFRYKSKLIRYTRKVDSIQTEVVSIQK